MRIAVTYEDGYIFQHFGHTAQFKIYDVQDGQVVASQMVDTNGSGHGALAALLSGAAVSFAGLLGFVGLIVPHMGRRLVSNESGKLLPFCALAGAGLVTLCDLLARTLFMPYEIPVGILLAFVGGPFFLMLLIRRKGGHSL